MKLFKRKLEKRIASLEDYLGLYYITDIDGYTNHITSGDESYARFNRIDSRLDALEKKK